MLKRRHWTDRLVKLDACKEAVEWARSYPSLSAAWLACERGDWMLWLAGRLSGLPESASRKRLVLAACACSRLALPIFERRYPTDRRPRVAIETAERWARGEGPTLAEVRTSAGYADAAASAAAAADTAVYAAYAASASAYHAAYHAASAADAASDAAADAAADTTRTTMLRKCADIVRQHYPRPPRWPTMQERKARVHAERLAAGIRRLA